MERKLDQELNLLENKKLGMNLYIVAIVIVNVLTVLWIVFSGGFQFTNGFARGMWRGVYYFVAIDIQEADNGCLFKEIFL